MALAVGEIQSACGDSNLHAVSANINSGGNAGRRALHEHWMQQQRIGPKRHWGGYFRNRWSGRHGRDWILGWRKRSIDRQHDGVRSQWNRSGGVRSGFRRVG